MPAVLSSLGLNKFVTSHMWVGFCCVIDFWLFFLKDLMVLWFIGVMVFSWVLMSLLRYTCHHFISLEEIVLVVQGAAIKVLTGKSECRSSSGTIRLEQMVIRWIIRWTHWTRLAASIPTVINGCSRFYRVISSFVNTEVGWPWLDGRCPPKLPCHCLSQLGREEKT